MTENRTPTDDIYFLLGGIQSSLETITRTLSEDRTASAQYRTDIRNELKEHHSNLQKVSSDLRSAKDDIADMKPKVANLEARALMSAGAAKLAILLGKFAHIISAAVGGGVALLVERWLNGR